MIPRRAKKHRSRKRECVITLDPAQMRQLREVLPAQVRDASSRATVLVRWVVGQYIASRKHKPCTAVTPDSDDEEIFVPVT